MYHRSQVLDLETFTEIICTQNKVLQSFKFRSKINTDRISN